MGSAIPLYGTKLVVVEPGTVVRGQHGGTVTVTDTRFAHKGDTIYCTQRVYDAVKLATPAAPRVEDGA